MPHVRDNTPQRSKTHAPGWTPFEKLAGRYDAWFDTERGRRIFRVETDCIRDLLVDTPRPWLEVGVGTGRFGAALNVDEGVDPSPAVLRYACQRGIRVSVGEAEHLPYDNRRFGVVLLVVTICFLADPAEALRECRRVLKPGAFLVVGIVPKDSPWGQAYACKGEHGHPFYSLTTFYTSRELIRMVEKHGFYLEWSRSCLFKGPETDPARYARPREKIIPNAGFVGMRFKKSVGLA
ncbi:MAG: class I SAM-dependent methyltransferase [Kiritimatiellae bacterium]|nr:class I SAM-dependent methyltransferase [Kiritimatiellia bacterium]